MQVAVSFDSSEAINIAGPDHYDLRADPRELDRIEPARRLVALRSFLLGVNVGDSPFATVGCKVWKETAGEAAENHVCASRVDLIFLRESANFGRGPYEDLARRLAELLEREPGETVRAELRQIPARFPVDNRGYCLRLILYARGATPEQAEVRLGLGLARVQQALMFVARVLRQQGGFVQD